MSADTATWALTVAGAGLEIIGLTWIVAEASRERRQEFGEVGLLRRIGRWFSYWLFEEPPKRQIINLGIATSSAVAGGVAVMGVANETDVQRLERLLAQLTERLDNHEAATTKQVDEMRAETRQLEARLSGQLTAAEAQNRERRRRSLRREMSGARLFIVGAILSAAGNLV